MFVPVEIVDQVGFFFPLFSINIDLLARYKARLLCLLHLLILIVNGLGVTHEFTVWGRRQVMGFQKFLLNSVCDNIAVTYSTVY